VTTSHRRAAEHEALVFFFQLTQEVIMARKTVAELNAIIDDKVARILTLEATIAELRAKPERSTPTARVTELGALYEVRSYGRFFKVAVPYDGDVRAALAEFRSANPKYAQSTVAVERY